MSGPGTGPGRLTPELLLRAYASGIFPMAENRDAEDVFWVDPKVRGILPLDAFHVPRRLGRKVRGGYFEIRADTAFDAVIRACAEPGEDRRKTWINDDIIHAYGELHRLGFAHSVECWRDRKLVGGLYGVSLGGVFCGESMFTRQTDASKVALVHLVARLELGGFALLDVQFVTDHLKQFGAVEIPARAYLERLREALRAPATFHSELSSSREKAAIEEVLSRSRTKRS